MPVPVRRAGSAPSLRMIEQLDFTGGLNLTDDRFNLEDNESPDISNVDVQRRGGFESRRTVQPFGNDPVAAWEPTGTPSRLWIRQDAANGAPQVLVANGSGTWYGTGGVWASVVASGMLDHAQLNGISYLTATTVGPRTWDGSTVSAALTDPSVTAWQNDYAAPSGTHAPRARLCAEHQGYMWVADTLENGTRYESRVRFSHPNTFGSWAVDDWVACGLGDGDAIQRIVSFRDHLLVIKNTSVWAIYGYDRQTFQVVQVDATVGATNYHAVAASPDVVWLFSADRGLYAWDGEKLVWAFPKLYPRLGGGIHQGMRFDSTKLDEVQVMWVRDRVWVRIEHLGGDIQTFPLDPTTGAWTSYDLDIRNAKTYYDANGTPTVVASTGVNSWIVSLGNDGVADNFGDGDVPFSSYYTTPWIAGGNPFLPKRWKRPEFVVRCTASHLIQVDVFQDYDDAGVSKTLLLSIEAPPAGTALVWGSGLWGTGVWGGESGSQDCIVRGSAISGTGRALMLRFNGPIGVQWEVRAFTLKYRPKRPRS